VATDTRKSALKAATWVIMGFGSSQVIRLFGNIILTRLLSPELFGIMALAYVFLTGLSLFSDIGLEPCVIRSPRYNDKAFLNTAWTIQIVRGGFLFLSSILIAYPIAVLYEESSLIFVIPAIGLNAVFQSFNSTVFIELNKELKQDTLMIIEITTQVISLIILIVLAYFLRNIWALILGRFAASLIKVVWGHKINKSRDWFFWDKEAVIEIINFGKWIMVATAMMFLANQADKLILGKIFPFALLGIYNVAIMFAELPKQVIKQISQKVIFPVFTRFKDLPRIELRNKIHNKRFYFLTLLAFGVALLGSFGDLLIEVLYDERYKEAAWMLPLLALGIWPVVLTSTIDRALYVYNKTQYPALANFTKFLYMVICIPLFYFLMGNLGGVIAVTLNDIPVYIIVNLGLIRERMSFLKQDLISTIILLAFLLLFQGLRLILGLGFTLEILLPGAG